VEFEIERDAEIERVLARAVKEPRADLEAWEGAIRVAVLQAGAKCLSGLLQQIGSGCREQPLICECGARMESRGLKDKMLVTILGEVQYKRSWFQCPVCRKTRYPGDEELDVQGTSRSPGLRRFMARAGGKQTFKEACEDLKVYAGVQVSAKDVERVAEKVGHDMERWANKEREQLLQQALQAPHKKSIPIFYISADGTGVSMIKRELQGRKGKQPDGTAKTREAKLGCVFTQTTTDAEGRPVRDPDSTTFVGAIEESEPFGWRLYAEALRRGLINAVRIVVLGDGAKWIRTIVEIHFPDAIHIVDLYHAREHISELCKLLWINNPKHIQEKRLQWWDLLDAGNVEEIVQQAERYLWTAPTKVRRNARKEIAYLENNKDRMRYADYRAQGLFVGSGVIEAGCKSLIGQRMKQSGMEWSVRGANDILSLRCITLSNRLDDYWEARVA